MTPVALTVRKVNHRGAVLEWVLNPLWVRLDKVVHEEFGIERLFRYRAGASLPSPISWRRTRRRVSPPRSARRWPRPSAG